MSDVVKIELINWLRQMGFIQDPFADTEAKHDPYLQTYFVEPPCFESILGTADQPQSAVLFAPRGGGKTANWVMVRRFCQIGERVKSVLSVEYTDFTKLIMFYDRRTGLWNLNIHHHVALILEQAVAELVRLLQAGRLPQVGQSRDTIAHLLRLLITYASDQTIGEMAALLPDLGLEASLLNQPSETRQTLFARETRAWDDLQALVNNLPKLNINGLYILIDRIDEFDPTSTNTYSAASFLRPLLSHLPLLNMPHVACKFFLPSSIKSILLREGILREDRLVVKELKWSDSDLRRMLHSRLYAFSDGLVPTLEPLFTTTALGEEAEHRLVCCAERSPRKLILACRQLLDTHIRYYWKADNYQIGRDALETAISTFVGNQPQPFPP